MGEDEGRRVEGRVVAYPAYDEAEFVHGTVLDVDGGRAGVAVVAAT